MPLPYVSRIEMGISSASLPHNSTKELGKGVQILRISHLQCTDVGKKICGGGKKQEGVRQSSELFERAEYQEQDDS